MLPRSSDRLIQKKKMSEAFTAEYAPKGEAWALFNIEEDEVIISGPSGTGKTRACLEKLDYLARQYPGMRGAIVRKTRRSMTQSVMVTWVKKVIWWDASIHFRTGEQEYRYSNGSVIVLGGLDKVSKILSTEFDLVFINQAEEVTENDWEFLTTRLRHGVMPYQQIVGDCNPDHPRHWLKLRADAGRTTMLESRHEDNPELWDGQGWTLKGKAYIAKLDALTGVRYLRLRKGQWAAAEGLVYEFDRHVHLVDSFAIPDDWRRIRVVDFGFTNPFCCQWWAVDGDGRMYRYRELYMTRRTVRVHAEKINELSKGERIEATVCDWDAEDRATLAENGIPTKAADKAITRGVQAVQERLKVQGDGKPRLFLLRDALVERDQALIEDKKPACTEEEIDAYVWPKGVDGKAVKEQPVKLNDHGMDAMRYGAMYLERPHVSFDDVPQAETERSRWRIGHG